MTVDHHFDVDHITGEMFQVVLGTPKSKLEQPVQVLEQVVQGMSVFLLTTNMRLFLNPIINDIFSPILICENPFL